MKKTSQLATIDTNTLNHVTGGFSLRGIFGGGSSSSLGDKIDRKIDSHMPLNNLAHPGM